MKVRRFGEALLEVEPLKYLEEWYMAMKSMQKRMNNAPGIPNPRCYRYEWVTRSFWDFRLRQQGILPGISYSKASKAPAGNMALHDRSLAGVRNHMSRHTFPNFCLREGARATQVGKSMPACNHRHQHRFP